MNAAAGSLDNRERTGVSRGWLCFGLLGGLVAWTAHLMFAYVIAEFGCLSPSMKETFLGLTAVAWSLLVLSVVTLVIAAYATLVARRVRRTPGVKTFGDEDEPAEDYVARAGMILSGLSTFIILIESIPILYYLHDC